MTVFDVARLACAAWWTWMLVAGRFAVTAPLAYRVWYRRFPAAGTRYVSLADVPFRRVKHPNPAVPGEWVTERRQRLTKRVVDAGQLVPRRNPDGTFETVRTSTTEFVSDASGFLTERAVTVDTGEVAFDLAGAWEVYDEPDSPQPGPYAGEAHYLGRLLSCVQCGPVYVVPFWWLAWRLWPSGTLEAASVLTVLVGVMVVNRYATK